MLPDRLYVPILLAGSFHVKVLLIIYLLIVVAVMTLFATYVVAEPPGNMLQNAGFEDGLNGWSKSFGSDLTQVSDPVRSGAFAASRFGSGQRFAGTFVFNTRC